MESDRTAQIEDLFDQVCELPEKDRAAFLEKACDGDPEVRREVESLLAYYTADFLETPVRPSDYSDGEREPADLRFEHLQVLCDPPEGDAPGAPRPGSDPASTLIHEGSRHNGRSPVVPSSTVPPRYQVRSLLGQGGMGKVYLARDELLARDVAVKIARDQQESGRFLDEAVTGSLLDHPNIAPVHDFGVDGSGRPLYVMRHIRGMSLAEVFEERQREPGAWSLPRLLTLFQQACLAVHYAHSRGVVHRDLKPANIMIGEYGELYVVDWGLSTASTDTRPHRSTISGTPAYMAPEQTRGAPSDPRGDVFSLGIILFEIVTGTHPFPGQNLNEVLDRVRRVDVQRGPEWEATPPELRQQIDRALDPEPQGRTESARALHDAIQDFLEGTKEKRRRREAADRALQQATVALEERARLLSKAQDLEEQVRLQRPDPWAGVSRKKAQWKIEDAFRSQREAADLAQERAVDHLIEGLGHVRDDLALRRALGEIYWQRFLEAEERQDVFPTRFFETRLRRLEVPELTDRLDRRIGLSVQCDPAPRLVTLRRLAERDRVLRARSPRPLSPDDIRWESDPMTSWELTLEHPEHRPIVAPVFARRDEDLHLQWRFRREEEIGDDFIQVPPGPFLMGGDPDTFQSLPRSQPDVSEFFISRFPVTWEDYRSFIANLHSEAPEEARSRLPRMAEGGKALWKIDEKGHVHTSAEARIARARRRWPIFGVSWLDAVAYCEWRSGQEARCYTLPTDEQWEKAARGVDGRTFPWGDHFDPGFCKMADSTEAPAQPEPVGRYRRDTSPYGVRDLAGGIREWCASWFDEKAQLRLVRGGSWNFSEIGAHCAYRLGAQAHLVYPFLGFRLVHQPPRARSVSPEPAGR